MAHARQDGHQQVRQTGVANTIVQPGRQTKRRSWVTADTQTLNEVKGDVTDNVDFLETAFPTSSLTDRGDTCSDLSEERTCFSAR